MRRTRSSNPRLSQAAVLGNEPPVISQEQPAVLFGLAPLDAPDPFALLPLAPFALPESEPSGTQIPA